MKQSWEFESTNAEECKQMREVFYAAVNPMWQNVVGAVRRQYREIRAPLFAPWDVQREHDCTCYAYMSQKYDTLRVGVVVNNLHHAYHQDVLQLVHTLSSLSSHHVAI